MSLGEGGAVGQHPPSDRPLSEAVAAFGGGALGRGGPSGRGDRLDLPPRPRRAGRTPRPHPLPNEAIASSAVPDHRSLADWNAR